MHAVYCNGLHPNFDSGQHAVIRMMTCASLTFPEDLKLLLKEGLAKFCPPIIVPREYEALQCCLSPGEPGTKGHYLLGGLSALSGSHMRLRDVLLFQPDFLQEATTPFEHPWHELPFLALSAPDTLDTPRDQRTSGEVGTYLKVRFRPKP